jgi:hypothetical protein
MHDSFREHSHINSIMVPEQFGFWKGTSTENAAYKLTDTELRSLNQKRNGEIFCNLAKVFDYVNNETLLVTYTFMAFKEQVQIGSDLKQPIQECIQ